MQLKNIIARLGFCLKIGFAEQILRAKPKLTSWFLKYLLTPQCAMGLEAHLYVSLCQSILWSSNHPVFILGLISGNQAQRWRSSLLGAPSHAATWGFFSTPRASLEEFCCARYSQNLKEKTGHMKQMAAELEMYHNQVGCLLSGVRGPHLRVGPWVSLCRCEVQDLKEEIDRHNKVGGRFSFLTNTSFAKNEKFEKVCENRQNDKPPWAGLSKHQAGAGFPVYCDFRWLGI